MAITSNVGGTIKTLQTIHTSVSGTLKELNTIYTSVGGTLKQIHSGEKCLDINLASLTSSKATGTYEGVTYPENLTPSASLYVPGMQTLLKVETDLSALSSDFDYIKDFFRVHPNTDSLSGYVRNRISGGAITFAARGASGGNGNGYGGGTVIEVYATADGNYLRFYLLYFDYSYSPTSQNCTVKEITTPLKAKLYYK